MEKNVNGIKVVLSKFFDRKPADGEQFSFCDFFLFAEEEVKKLNTYRKNNQSYNGSLVAMRLLGPLFELSELEIDRSDNEKKYANLISELVIVIDKAITRGFFDGKKVTVKEFSEIGIELDAIQIMLI